MQSYTDNARYRGQVYESSRYKCDRSSYYCRYNKTFMLKPCDVLLVRKQARPSQVHCMAHPQNNQKKGILCGQESAKGGLDDCTAAHQQGLPRVVSKLLLERGTCHELECHLTRRVVLANLAAIVCCRWLLTPLHDNR